MSSVLKIVATPLGNVNDISLRAMEAIRSADAIFAEDTRHSLKLITALDLELKPHCRLISCDAHKEQKRIEVIIEKLRAQENVILISDAGCPTISDPGSLLVQGVIEAGLGVEVIPGPSALTAAIMGAGVDTTRFAFLGFLPQKESARKDLVLSSAKAGLALVIYESPLRVSKLLDELHSLVGARRVVVARELTKAFETFHRGLLGSALVPPFMEKGECVVVVEAQKPLKATMEDQHDDLVAFINDRAGAGISAKDITREAALHFGLSKNEVYDVVNRMMKGEQ